MQITKTGEVFFSETFFVERVKVFTSPVHNRRFYHGLVLAQMVKSFDRWKFTALSGEDEAQNWDKVLHDHLSLE